MPEQPQERFLDAAQPVADKSTIAMIAKNANFKIFFIFKSTYKRKHFKKSLLFLYEKSKD